MTPNKINRFVHFPNCLKWRHFISSQKGGGGASRESRHLNVKVTKRDIWKYCPLWHTHVGNASDKGEDVLLWRCLYSLPPWEKSTGRQWKCSVRNREGEGLFLSALASPPSLTNQAWNDCNIKSTRFCTSPAGSIILDLGNSFRLSLYHASVTERRLFFFLFFFSLACTLRPALIVALGRDRCVSCRWGVRGWKRDRFTVRFIEASQTASRPRIPPLRLSALPLRY